MIIFSLTFMDGNENIFSNATLNLIVASKKEKKKLLLHKNNISTINSTGKEISV